jgi:CheY-like chemotaxis protein/anti-sigma regulatory factor (Ser/Thr protein kinase)
VTELKQAEAVLTQDRAALEQRVDERTRALTEANTALERARRDAEQATGAQRRFVAAASHDLVQPMHAARLFIGNALLSTPSPEQRAAGQGGPGRGRGAPHAPGAVDTVATGTGRLAATAATGRRSSAHARACRRIRAGGPCAGLQLVVMPTRLWLHSDRDLLRSILQNLLVNALRYTPQGRVVMLARRRGDTVRLEVRDSGVGIADDQLPQAFREFGRLAEGQVLAEGTGLGLSIVARIAAALGHRVEVASRKGVGSVFAVIAPASAPVPVRVAPTPVQADLAGLAVLCVDDDPDILLAVGALIERWGAVVTRCANLAEVPAGGHWDAAVADYQLPDGNGLDLLRDLAGRCPLRILVTATPGGDWASDLPAEGICLLAKPTPPLALQALLAQQASAAGRRESPGCAFHNARSVPRECEQLRAGLHPSLRKMPVR